MQRRDAIKLLMAGGVLPALSPDVLAFFQDAQPKPGDKLRTLNAHQNDTVVAMMDIIVPERDAQLKGMFFKVFKGITLHGYYTSEIGYTQELKLQIIPGAQHGCQTIGPGVGEA